MRMKVTLLALLSAVSAVVAGQQNPFVGRWNLRGTGADAVPQGSSTRWTLSPNSETKSRMCIAVLLGQTTAP